MKVQKEKIEPFGRDEFYAVCMLYDKMCSSKFFLKNTD